MKVFHFLNQHLESWRQRPSQTAGNKASGISSSLPGWGQLQRIHPPLMLAVTVTALTSVVGYRFYNQPRLAVGTVSPTTIAAPEDGSFVDLKTTEDKRKEAQTAIVPIWQRDEEATGEIEAAVGEAIGEIESLRRLRRPLPWFAPQLLSSGTQQYLRTCSEADWQDILAAVKPPLTSLPPAPGGSGSVRRSPSVWGNPWGGGQVGGR